MKKCTVIITEDDNEDAEFLQQALRERSFDGEIQRMTDGVQLMTRLSEMKISDTLPEMIILDLNMPFKNGLEVLADMNTDDRLKQIPVTVVTASLRKEDEDTCDSLGCELYMRKPVRYRQYMDIASEIISHIKRKFPYC
jgi:two-component system response regulator